MRKAIALVVLAIVVAGCGTTPKSAEFERIQVDYLTSFSTFGRDAYAYVAQEKGFFDQAGLDVTITPGNGSVDVLKDWTAATVVTGSRPILKKYQPTQDAGVASAEVALMAPYVKPSGFTGPVGELTRPRVEKIIRTLVDAGAIPDGSMRPDDLASFALAPK